MTKVSKSRINSRVLKICKDSQRASWDISVASTEVKNDILQEVAKLLKRNTQKILKANQRDVKKAKANNLDAAKVDRLELDNKRVQSMINAIKDIIELPDPVGEITYDSKRDSGLHVQRVRTPIGVLLTIYESRPNVTSDVSALCIKSGNAVILRSGSDSINTSKLISDLYRQALEKFGISKNAVNFVQYAEREYVDELLKMNEYIDIVIPRGGKSLIKAIDNNSKIPVFRHLDGNCHTYIHEKADFDKARKILLNAKLRRVGICGATESVVVDRSISKQIIPLIVDDLINEGCEIVGEEAVCKIDERVKEAKDADFFAEYLDKKLSIKIVKDLDEAIKHINFYSSSHTESIITENERFAQEFLLKVNSAIVMHNASTQFADGGEFGLGAEVGIATGKLHARGPVGLEQLTIYKYQVTANCAVRK